MPLRMSGKLMRLLVAIAVFALVAASCGGGEPSPNGDEGKPIIKIAFFGATTGELAPLVVPSLQGAKLAFDQANAAADLPVTVEITEFDTQGSAVVAAPLVEEVVGDESYVGVIGPAFTDESAGVGDQLEAGGIPRITPSATGDELAQTGWTGWFRALGNNSDMGEPAGRYIVSLAPDRICAASDGSEYGRDLKDIVVDVVTADGIEVALEEDVDVQDVTDFSALVTSIADADCPVLFYGGFSPSAGVIRDQMTDAGLGDVTMVGGNGIKDPLFLDLAGESAEGTVASCPCADLSASDDAAAQRFISDYQAEFGEEPEIYSYEGYDTAQIYTAAFRAGNTDRASIIDFLHDLQGFPGLTKNYTWDANGELTPEGKVIYLYEAQGGVFVVLGSEEEVLGGT